MENTFLAVLLSVIAAYAVVKMVPSHTATETKKESTYDRVMRTNTIRCGYVGLKPIAWKDPNTGKMDGFAVKIFEEVAKSAGLKVDWVEEVGFGTMFSGLDTGRYDAICTGVWMNGARARVADFTREYLYSVVGVVTRTDDTRFDNDQSTINQEGVTITVIDGDTTENIAVRDFPKAKLLSLPQNAEGGQLFMNVADGKADIVFSEVSAFNIYSEKNPGKLKLLYPEKPLRIFPWVIAVKKGESQLVNFLNAALTELVYDGSIENIVRHYQAAEGDYYFVSQRVTR